MVRRRPDEHRFALVRAAAIDRDAWPCVDADPKAKVSTELAEELPPAEAGQLDHLLGEIERGGDALARRRLAARLDHYCVKARSVIVDPLAA